MAVLSRDEILKAIDEKLITIEPFDPTAINCASIDLRLSNEFRYYKPGLKVLDVKEETDYKEITERVTLKDGDTYLLLPGQACLGITVENVKLDGSICGLLEGRSRFARLGLFVHITAGFMNPGINSKQVLEIYNASNHPLALHPGQRVCQFIFMRMDGRAEYTGKFKTNTL